MTHDRVLRFVPVFDTPHQASRFATEQALAWIDGRVPALAPRARDVLACTRASWGLVDDASGAPTLDDLLRPRRERMARADS